MGSQGLRQSDVGTSIVSAFHLNWFPRHHVAQDFNVLKRQSKVIVEDAVHVYR